MIASLFTAIVGAASVVGATSLTKKHPNPTCIDDANAQLLADNWAWMVASWALDIPKSEGLLNVTIAENNFTDYSDSIRVVESRGCTNGPEPLDDSREAFAADQLSLSPFQFDVLKVWHSCDTVTFLWEAPVPAGAQRTRGLILFETTPSPFGPHASPSHVIQTAYSEFNTGSYLVSTHAYTPANCTGAAPVLSN